MTRRDRFTRRLVAGVVAVAVALAAAACSSSTRPGRSPQGQRGTLVKSTAVPALRAPAVAAHLERDRYAAARVRFGVEGFRLTYRTLDAAGRTTTATGLLVLPRSGAVELDPVVFEHGTMSARDEAPSVDDGARSDEALLFASAGYAALAPDYLGLGEGPGAHPYLQARTEASATVDLLRAAGAFAARHHRRLNDRVLVTGFSQGGQAAMATSKALLGGVAEPFRLRATGAVSGPYRIRTAEFPAALAGSLDARDSVFYVAYLLLAWNRLYHLYADPAEVFRPPYASTLERLFDGAHHEPQVFAQLPATLSQLLTPHGLELLRHPTPALAAALAANDATCTAWPGRVPVRLYLSRADEQVAPANTRQCADDLRASGLQPDVIDLGALDHFASERAGLADVLAWFLGHYPPVR